MMYLNLPMLSYFTIYGITVLAYLWYRFIFRFIFELKKKKESFYLTDYPYSVVVPAYNEEPWLLKNCIESLMKSWGTHEVIIVNDGTKDEAFLKTLSEMKKKYPDLKIIHQENMGKRYAQKAGMDIAKYPFIVTVDSDAYVFENSIPKLLQPFSDLKVGAVTGRAHAINRNKNMLTKMIDARYKNAFGFERAALSALGVVTCCSGVLSAYRTNVINPLLDRYIHQRFLGEECTYGDDRHLTNLVLMNDYKIEYVDEAIVYTDVPSSFRKFVKQQVRWKKSFIRESLVALSFSWKKSFWLTLEVAWNLFLPYFALIARLATIFLIFIYPAEIFTFIIAVITIAIIRNLLLWFEDKKAAFWSIPYAFIHEFVLYWLFWYALFRLKDRRWGTR